MSEIHYGLEDADIEYVKTIEKCHFYGMTDILPKGSCFGENRIGDIWQFTPLNRAIIWYQDRWHLLPTLGLPSEGSYGYSESSAEEKADEEHDKVIAEMFTIIEDLNFPDEHYNRMARAIDKMEEYKEILDKKDEELKRCQETIDMYKNIVEDPNSPDKYKDRLMRAIEKIETQKKMLDTKEKELTHKRQVLDKYKMMVEEYEKLTQQYLETMTKQGMIINSSYVRLNEWK